MSEIICKSNDLLQKDEFIAPHHVLLAILELSSDVHDILEGVSGISTNATMDAVKQLRPAKVLKHESRERFRMLNE